MAGQQKDTLKAVVQYKGHKFVNGHVQLMYTISDSTGSRSATISEQVEAGTSAAGGMVLNRVFEVSAKKEKATWACIPMFLLWQLSKTLIAKVPL
ncbi:MAG: hypothetical protein IPH36_16815 [Saprospiraceae bacterium]|nr:hypothetical protein [Saprospiraceae bacterium]